MAMVFCRGCGKEIHETAASCPHCGALQNNLSSKCKVTYSSYDQVPWYRKAWIARLILAFLSPVGWALFATGDIYYEKKGQLKTFTRGEKIFLIILFAFATIFLVTKIMPADLVKTELVMYDSEIRANAPLKKEIGEGLLAAQRSENYDDMVSSWNKCMEYQGALHKISGKLHTSEVNALHETLLESTTKLCAGLAVLADGLSKEDLSLVSQGAIQLSEAAKMGRQWELQMKALEVKYNLVRK